MLRGDFAPGLRVDHFAKISASHSTTHDGQNSSCPVSRWPNNSMSPCKAEGRGENGVQALVLTLARLSSVEWPGEGDPS
jgi:hypothetical protein